MNHQSTDRITSIPKVDIARIRFEMSGPPSLEVLFRDNSRLEKKISAEERKGLKKYIDDCVLYEHSELLFRTTVLRNKYEALEKESSDTIESLRFELGEKSTIVENYKNSDENLANVYRRRGDRLLLKHTELTNDVQRYEHEMQRINSDNDKLTDIIKQQEGELLTFEEKLKDQEVLSNVSAELEISKSTNKDLSQQLLKLKCDMDDKIKEIMRLQDILTQTQEECSEHKRNITDLEIKISQMAHEFDDKISDIATFRQEIAHYKFCLEEEKRTKKLLEKKYLQTLKTDAPSTEASSSSLSVKNPEIPKSSTKQKSVSEIHAIMLVQLSTKVKFLEQLHEAFKTEERLLHVHQDHIAELQHVTMKLANSWKRKDEPQALQQLTDMLQHRTQNVISALERFCRVVPAKLESDIVALLNELEEMKTSEDVGQKGCASSIANLIARVKRCRYEPLPVKYSSLEQKNLSRSDGFLTVRSLKKIPCTYYTFGSSNGFMPELQSRSLSFVPNFPPKRQLTMVKSLPPSPPPKPQKMSSKLDQSYSSNYLPRDRLYHTYPSKPMTRNNRGILTCKW